MFRRLLRLGSTANYSIFLKEIRLDDAVLSQDDLVCLESTTTYNDGENKINNRVQTRPERGELTYHTVTSVENSNQETARLIEYPSGNSSIFLQNKEGGQQGKDLTQTTSDKKCEEIKVFLKNNTFAAGIFCNMTKGLSIEETLVKEGHQVITRSNKI